MRQPSTSTLGEVLEDALEGVVEGLDALDANTQAVARQRARSAGEAQTSFERTRRRSSASISTDSTARASSRPAASARGSDESRRTTNGRSLSFCRIARKSPLAASLPPTMRWMLSASSSTSSRMWDETRTVRPSRREPSDHFAEVEPLDGVGARERLVEQKQIRVVDERCGEARPLTHPAGVPAQPTRLRVRQPDRRHGRLRSRGRFGHLLESRAELDELEPREEVVDRLVLRHVADPPIERGVAADALAEDAHRPLGRRRQTGDHAQEGRLARAVRAEQRDHAWFDGERDVGDGNDAAEPLRDVVDCDRRRRGEHGHWRTSADVRRTRSAPRTTVSPTSQSAETPADTGRLVFGSP